MTPTETWLLVALCLVGGMFSGLLRYALSLRALVRQLQDQAQEDAVYKAEVELGLRDTRTKRRQLRVVHGDQIGTFTRYGRKPR